MAVFVRFRSKRFSLLTGTNIVKENTVTIAVVDVGVVAANDAVYTHLAGDLLFLRSPWERGKWECPYLYGLAIGLADVLVFSLT